MTIIMPTYIFILVLLAITICLIIYFTRRKLVIVKSKDSQKDSNHTFNIVLFIEQLLEELNCNYKTEIKDKWYEYNFQFQSGNFILLCKENDNFIRIHYPNFFNTTIDNLDLVRENCNASNAHLFNHHVVYTTNGAQNSISLHITSSLCFVNNDSKYKEVLSENLIRYFSIAQDFYVHFNLTKEKYKNLSTLDIEKDYLKYEREFFILKEVEINHLPKDSQYNLSLEKPLKISQIITKFYNYNNPEFLELKIVTHQLKTIVDENAISNFDISKVLVSLNQKGEPNFSGRNATLIITFYPKRNNTEGFPKQLTIALENEGRTTDILFMRATLSTSPNDVQNKNSAYASHNKPQMHSFIFAYENVGSSQKRQDIIDLINKTAQQIQNGDSESITKEQYLIYKFTTPEIQSYREHAESLFRQRRYYETIIEFEYLFNYLSPLYLGFTNSLQEFFYDVCYYIGFSYSQIGLHKQAYYYLDIIFPLNNYTYMKEYVNNLVDSKDFRTLSIIDNILSSLASQLQESSGELPENVKHFVKFLQRRKAYHLVDLGQYEQAKKIFEILYQDPECQDYALNELAYIQSLNEKKDQLDKDISEN